MNSYSEQLLGIVKNAKIQLDKLSEQELSIRRTPDKWSKKMIIGHLIDSASNNHRRIVLALLKDDLLFDGYDQEKWVLIHNYQDRKGTEIIDTWVTLNRHIASLVVTIKDDKLNAKTTLHNFHLMSMLRLQKGSPSDLAYLIWDYIYHIEHHLSQVFPSYEKKLLPYSS